MNKLYVVGIGPGDEKNMTLSCRETLAGVDTIIGYGAYAELIKPLFPDKAYISTGMMRETERCRAALEIAGDGGSVAVVCSGDSGVYGMAGLVYELSVDFSPVEIEIIAGVTSAVSGAAVLGAPLMHDFAVISLSDLMTPWDLIEKRIDCSAMSDFVLVLYNPSSKGRGDYLKNACDIILRHRAGSAVCGVAKNTGREGGHSEIMTLRRLREYEADMFCTVFIGNSQTKIINGKMVTPRGYKL